MQQTVNRSFYSYAIFFTALLIGISLFQSIMSFVLREKIYALQSFRGWFILVAFLSFIWSLLLLKYYGYRQYKFTFWALIVSMAASAFHSVSFYNLVSTREIMSYHFIAVLLEMVTGMVYAISLIFSRAGRRPWLKAAGIFLLLLSLLSIAFIIAVISSISFRISETGQKAEQWVSLLHSLVPLLFIMNFLNERSTAGKVNTSRQSSFNEIIVYVAVAGVAATLFLGVKVTGEGIRLLGNPDNVGEYAKDLARPFASRKYVNSAGDILRYRLLMPLDYDSTKVYPLVVLLHGSSGRGSDNVMQVAACWPSQMLTSDGSRRKYQAFLFVPQCPEGSGWGGVLELPAVDSLVFETIAALEEEFPVDVKRRYVVGNSMGGYGAWHFICTRPEMFAAAIPISGEGDPRLANKIVDVPVWAFHGAKDLNVPVSGSRDIIDAMEKAGGNPRYTEYPDEAHHIGKSVTETAGLMDWLFEQRRE